MKYYSFFLVMVFFTVSCTGVDSGHRGVKIQYGGKTDLEQTYNEGLHSGFNWLWDDMVEYDVREQTMVQKFEFNDKNEMTTGVELALDFRLDPERVNYIHSKVTDYYVKVQKTLKSAGKEVVPQYTAAELNKFKRTEAESKLSKILEEELPDFYVQFARLQITDVDIPKAVSDLAEQTAVQLGKNKLASKKEEEKKFLANAVVAEATGKFKADSINVEAMKLKAQPKLLELRQIEAFEEFAKKGISPYGSGNVYGSETAVVKGLPGFPVGKN